MDLLRNLSRLFTWKIIIFKTQKRMVFLLANPALKLMKPAKGEVYTQVFYAAVAGNYNFAEGNYGTGILQSAGIKPVPNLYT